MSMDVLNPVEIETRIRDISNRIAASAGVCNERYKAFLMADHAYDLAESQAYLDHDGPAHEKKRAAELAVKDLREARDVADAAYRYADRTAKALESELRAYQSVGASVRAMYQVAGRGEGS
jgi:hypothetical protein